MRICYVQNCKTNLKSTVTDDRQHLRRACFAFPNDEEMISEWLKRIPRDKEANLKNVGVCILHFEPHFIKKMTRKHVLSKDAIPTIFDSYDSFDAFDSSTESTEDLIDNKMYNQQNTHKPPVIKLIKVQPEIMNFDYLRSHLTEKLKLDNWTATIFDQNIYVYKLNQQPDGNLSIRSTINIGVDLTVKVFVNNNSVGGIIPVNLRISHWKQLQNIIDKLNIMWQNADNRNNATKRYINPIVDENDRNNLVEIKCESLDSSDADLAVRRLLPEEQDQDLQIQQEQSTAVKVEDQRSYPNIEGYYFDIKQVDEIDDVEEIGRIEHVDQEENVPDNQQDTLTRHICSECGKEYDQYARLMIHMKRHDPTKLQTCQVCNKSVYGNMDRHMRAHDNVNRNYKCEICNTQYATRASLKYHWYSLHSDGEFYCDVCNDGKNYKTKLRIGRHMKVHAIEVEVEKPALDIENFQLEWLLAQENKMKNQQSPASMDKGFKRETDLINRTANICPKCGKAYSRKDKLEMHMKRHDQSRWKICPICNKSFPDGLPRHMKTHLKIKEHVCDICGMAYKQAFSLKHHKDINHSAKIEYFCDICKNGRIYVSKYNLRKHLRSHVKKSNAARNINLENKRNVNQEKKHPCDQCGKKFHARCVLNQHVASVHSGVKECQCEICHKMFAHKGLLASHKKVHADVPKFSCHECGKLFTLANYLKKHLDRHKGLENKRRMCHLCDKRYVHGVDLRSHLKKIHGIDQKPGSQDIKGTSGD